MNDKNQKDSTVLWAALSIIAVGGTLFGYFLAALYASNGPGSAEQSGAYLGWSALEAVVASAVCVVATFKVKNWWKILPIVCLGICLLVVGLAFFGYSFSGYGSSY